MQRLLLTIAAFSTFLAFGQHSTGCITSEPGSNSIKEIEHLLDGRTKSTEIRIIPVVFHVLHEYGSENITDAQIFDQLEILNKDFQLANADTTFVLPPFDTIKGKVNFEFRLAHINPWGNPTTGINRIPTPLTNHADMNAMINMWDPAHYVNIWIVRNFNSSGISYSSNPLESNEPCNRGIIIAHNYVGSIGTSNPPQSRELTHEMGHFFGLFHTWGAGDNNVTCGGTDGIYDTPYTKGSSTGVCSQLANTCDDEDYTDSFNYWGTDVRDNTENFMDYSYCGTMFTKTQAELMRAVQENPVYGRDTLSMEQNLIATGTGPGPQTPSEAIMFGYFAPASRRICLGQSVQMLNGTGMSNGDTYLWDFPGGTPATSTEFEPTVTYNTPGFHDITFHVTTSGGGSTFGNIQAVYVSEDLFDIYGPNLQDFDVDNQLWTRINHFFDTPKFARIDQNGVNGTPCYVLNNALEYDSTQLCNPFTAETDLTGKVDELISPAFGLNYTSNIVVSFDYAYGSSETDIADMTEKLRVLSSRDCGETWVQRKVLTDTALTTGFANSGTVFIPNATQWKHASFSYPANSSDYKTRFKFEFTAENHSNYLYIDNFEISGLLGTDEASFNYTVYPNPVESGSSLHFDIPDNAAALHVRITDLSGKVILDRTDVQNSLDIPSTISSGLYLLNVNNQIQQLVIR